MTTSIEYPCRAERHARELAVGGSVPPISPVRRRPMSKSGAIDTHQTISSGASPRSLLVVNDGGGLRVGDVETCSIVGRIRPEFGLLASATGR